MDLSVLLKEDISDDELIQLIDEMKITSMSRRDIIKHAEDNGWEFEREGKEHSIYRHKDAIHKLEIPRHRNISIGVVRQLITKSDPNWKDPRLLNNSYNESNKYRIIREVLDKAIERNRKKKNKEDRFIANPELKSNIMKEN